MFKRFPAARRVLIYMVLSYIALVIVNNSTIEYKNMWIIYTPMFIGVYIVSRWIDSRIATQGKGSEEEQKTTIEQKGFGD